jgi:predicted TIM-barrel fold metal-dependent hydrolase
LAAMPLPDVEASLKEIAYAFDTLHADGVGIPTSFGNVWPGDARFDPFWAELNRRKAIVVMHPYAPNCCGDLQPHIAESLLEYPYDTGRAFASLLFTGTLVKYPDVRYTFCHGGGTLPYLAGRIVNLANGSVKDIQTVAPGGIEAMMKRMYYDTANATFPATMAALLREIPTSQIMFGTDYPYITGKENIGPLDADHLSAADLTAIAHGTAERMFPRLRGSV